MLAAVEPVVDPVALLVEWLDEARADERVIEPTAMTLATVAPDGRPSARMVLLKGVTAGGVEFFTNYASRKGRDLAANPWAAVVLHWAVLGRQVRVEGPVAKLADDESDAYFATRPRGSQLAAWASPQSDPIEDRGVLEAAVAAAASRFPEPTPVDRPPHWGGYRVGFDVIEFWEHRSDRLHERLRYRPVSPDRGGRWDVARLGP